MKIAKMKRFLKWFTTAALLALMIPVGFAQNINEREQNQRRRIRQGVQSGELTRGEAARARRQEGQIRRNVARARRSGGKFTPRERARINRRSNRESGRIYRRKHDAQTRSH